MKFNKTLILSIVTATFLTSATAFADVRIILKDYYDEYTITVKQPELQSAPEYQIDQEVDDWRSSNITNWEYENENNFYNP